MQLRQLSTLLVILVGSLISSFAFSLGLGDVTLKSSYNEPLNAEIRLLQPQDLSKDEILVGLASREDFSRVGLDRDFFLTSLKFVVVLEDRNNAYIKVTSVQPVQEPYLNFLVNMQWPSGRLLREYTLLLDLPLFDNDSATSSAVNAPTVDVVEKTITPNTSRSSFQVESEIADTRKKVTQINGSSVNKTPVSKKPATQEQASPSQVTVKSGDTLWELALQLRPNKQVSVQQTMLAIQQANPDAFIANNINLLRKGQVLRAPTLSEIQRTNFNEAIAAVKQQTQTWQQQKQTAPVISAVSPNLNAPEKAVPQEGRVTLGSADSSNGSQAVKGAGSSGSGESLQNELAITQEELDKSQRENSNLKNRINDLETQIKTLEDLVSLTNDQLKALEVAINQAEPNQAAAKEEAIAEIGGNEIVDSQPPVEQAEKLAVEQVEKPEQEENIEQLEQEENTEQDINSSYEDQAVAIEPVEPAEVSFVEKVTSVIFANLLYVTIGLLFLLLFIWFLVRPKKQDDYEQDDFDFDEGFVPLDADLVGDDVAEAIDDDQNAASKNESIDNDNDLNEENVVAQTDDIVAEAEIYSSLGKTDKAEELLQKEIQQNPDHAEARLALLALYLKTQNADAFDDQYAQLLPLGNEDANQKAKLLRAELKTDNDFDVDSYSLTDSNDSVSLDDAIDDEDDLLDLEIDEDLLTDLLAEQDSEENGLDLDDALDADDDLQDFSEDLLNLDNDILTQNIDLDEDDLEEVVLEEDDLAEDDFDFDLLDEEIDENADLGEDSRVIASKELDEHLGDKAEGLDVSFDSESSKEALFDTELDLDMLDVDADDQGFISTSSLDNEVEADPSESINSDEISLEADQLLENDGTFDLSDEVSVDEELSLTEDLAELTEESLNLESDESFELDVEELESVEPDVSADLAESSDFDLDLPPLDLDMASLDKELDEMTAMLDNDSAETETETEAETEAETEIEADVEDGLDSALTSLAEAEAEAEVSDEIIAAPVDTDDVDFETDANEVDTKLDLARAYLDMGDMEGAEDILQEVLEEGSDEQKVVAEKLLQDLSM